MSRGLEERLLADKKLWKTRKENRPLKGKKLSELRAPDVYETVRKSRKLRTCGEALQMVGAELRARFRETGHG